MSFLKSLQDTVNSSTENYLEVHFESHAEKYHDCACSEKRASQEISKEATVTHIVPQRYGGINSSANLQVLCKTCDSKKNIKSIY
jgi:5-methylcytosine-specific restriction endonuclease McrA